MDAPADEMEGGVYRNERCAWGMEGRWKMRSLVCRTRVQRRPVRRAQLSEGEKKVPNSAEPSARLRNFRDPDGFLIGNEGSRKLRRCYFTDRQLRR